jgi:hypothetical protein
MKSTVFWVMTLCNDIIFMNYKAATCFLLATCMAYSLILKKKQKWTCTGLHSVTSLKIASLQMKGTYRHVLEYDKFKTIRN